MIIDALNLDTIKLNKLIDESSDSNILIKNALGQRYIASGKENLNINIECFRCIS